MEAIAAPKSVPVTMLSGFLGAGANPDQHSYRCGHTSAAHLAYISYTHDFRIEVPSEVAMAMYYSIPTLVTLVTLVTDG